MPCGWRWHCCDAWLVHQRCTPFLSPSSLHLRPTLSLPAVAFHPGRAVPVSKTEAKLVDRWEQSLGAGALTSVAVHASAPELRRGLHCMQWTAMAGWQPGVLPPGPFAGGAPGVATGRLARGSRLCRRASLPPACMPRPADQMLGPRRPHKGVCITRWLNPQRPLAQPAQAQ